jgi:predicted hydrolase (HD superfamily)
MKLPTEQRRSDGWKKHVRDEYQRHHALMVATAMAGYAEMFSEDPELWYVHGLVA